MTGLQSRLPVILVTGFLGSGKTTLVQTMLQHPELADAAVIINELGEIGLDHLLVRKVTDEVFVLASGCLCCAVRDDLVETLRDLAERRASGELPPFRRVIVETSGLADPTSVATTLQFNAIASFRYRLQRVITTVDGLFGEAQLRDHVEAVNQVVLADRLILTKADLAPTDALARLRESVRTLNPVATLAIPSRTQAVDLGLVLREDEAIDEASRPLRQTGHTHGVSALSFTVAHPVDWDDFMAWLDRLMAEHGGDLLRLKGILRIAGREKPLVVHGMHHLLFPPEEIDPQLLGEDPSKLVLIMRTTDPAAIAHDLHAALGARLGDSP